MAITIVSQPPLYTGAFGNNKIIISTNNTLVRQTKYEIEVGSTTISSQFQPIYAVYTNSVVSDLRSLIDVRGLYMSMLQSYDNIIDTPDVFTEIEANNHQKEITDIIYEDDELGDYDELQRFIFKAVDVKYGDEWHLTKNFLPYHRDNNNKIIRKVFNGMKIPVSYYTQNHLAAYNMFIIKGQTSVYLGSTNERNRYRLATFKLDTTEKNNKINVGNSNISMDLILDDKTYNNPKILYFINRYGGWDWFCGIDYESREIVNKSQYTKYSNIETDVDILQTLDGYIVEQKIYGSPMDANSYEYLKDMINSPVVLDENGERVRVIDTSIRYDFRNLIDPVFTIQYIKKQNINY